MRSGLMSAAVVESMPAVMLPLLVRICAHACLNHAGSVASARRTHQSACGGWVASLCKRFISSETLFTGCSMTQPSAWPRLRVVTLVKSEALCPAMALPMTLGGPDATGYYGLSAPRLALVISRPTVAGSEWRFRRCSCRKFCATVGALLHPFPWRTRLGTILCGCEGP